MGQTHCRHYYRGCQWLASLLVAIHRPDRRGNKAEVGDGHKRRADVFGKFRAPHANRAPAVFHRLGSDMRVGKVARVHVE